MPSKQLEQFGYTQELKRSLGLWQLTAFGLNYMIPLSPAIFFGFILLQSGGTVALPFLIAGIGIFLTAMSYTVLVKQYPLAGSVYSFVGRAWHPTIGFIAGWILLLDYLLITTVTSMSASAYLHAILPSVPFHVFLLVFILLTGGINFFGINFLASFGMFVLLLIESVVFLGFIVWAYAIKTQPIGSGELFSLIPFHFTNLSSLISATSLAVACYLGFDAITTLAEEAKNPTKDIPKAIYLCIIIGCITMSMTGYLGVLSLPSWKEQLVNKEWLETTLFQVATITGDKGFALFYSIGFIISMVIFNMVATAATARLLFGMGRDGVLNKSLFAVINKKWKTPHWNILTIMLISFIVGSFTKIDEIAKLVNYGALLSFGILNLTVIRLYFIRRFNCNVLRYCLLPLLGLFVVAWVFYGLDRPTHILGTAWLLIGLTYLFFNRKAFS